MVWLALGSSRCDQRMQEVGEEAETKAERKARLKAQAALAASEAKKGKGGRKLTARCWMAEVLSNPGDLDIVKPRPGLQAKCRRRHATSWHGCEVSQC